MKPAWQRSWVTPLACQMGFACILYSKYCHHKEMKQSCSYFFSLPCNVPGSRRLIAGKSKKKTETSLERIVLFFDVWQKENVTLVIWVRFINSVWDGFLFFFSVGRGGSQPCLSVWQSGSMMRYVVIFCVDIQDVSLLFTLLKLNVSNFRIVNQVKVFVYRLSSQWFYSWTVKSLGTWELSLSFSAYA